MPHYPTDILEPFWQDDDNAAAQIACALNLGYPPPSKGAPAKARFDQVRRSQTPQHKVNPRQRTAPTKRSKK